MTSYSVKSKKFVNPRYI
uniref:Uncharacterized protein n=1 Tax=Rhizophora mucronata TaxID=61149 RepID=A0A2P2Q9E6_RHIMU